MTHQNIKEYIEETNYKISYLIKEPSELKVKLLKSYLIRIINQKLLKQFNQFILNLI